MLEPSRLSGAIGFFNPRQAAKTVMHAGDRAVDSMPISPPQLTNHSEIRFSGAVASRRATMILHYLVHPFKETSLACR